MNERIHKVDSLRESKRVNRKADGEHKQTFDRENRKADGRRESKRVNPTGMGGTSTPTQKLCPYFLVFWSIIFSHSIVGQVTYNVEWEQGTYNALSDFTTVIDNDFFLENGYFINGAEVQFDFGFEFPYFEDTHQSVILDGSGFGFFPNTDDDYYLQFYGGDYENFGFLTGNDISDWRYQNTTENGLKVLKVEWKDIGIFDDITSDNPSDHSINYQVWFYENGNIELHFGAINLDKSPNYDPTQGLMWDDGEVFGPWVGIGDYDFSRVYYVQNTLSDPQIGLNEDEADILLGIPPTGFVIRFVYQKDVAVKALSDGTSIDVFPTLATDVVHWKSTSQSIKDVCLFDILGNVVAKNIPFHEGQFDISTFNEGIYFLKFSDYNGMPVYQNKVVKTPHE